MSHDSNTTDARDELARDIFLADNSSGPDKVILGDWADLEQTEAGASYAHRIANGLIAKGYQKPRTVTTLEELDLLPDEAVVRSGFGVIHEKRVEFDTDRVVWVCPGDTDEHTAGKITLPATVLYEPEAEAIR